MTDQPRLIDDPRDGTEVHLDLGAVVLLALPAPGATGHRWQPVGNPAHVRIEQGELPADRDDPAARLPGRGGRAVFAVTGSAVGSETLTFALQRPWESEPIDDRHVRVTVA